MEVDTESTNTSVEDKTEDFCDNPTRDALTEGLMRLLKPTIDQLEEKVRTIRISQVELKQQIESLSEELKRINGVSSENDFDLEDYVKKLVNVKHKLTVISNILQSSEERLLKLQQNIAKDVNSQRGQLELSSIK
ncbi:hypothetical protein RUM43_013095 [Polyplax serrata]|uniref:Biogenesis of lysosome-related organelles complex 1 subunit 7 n=1 Tax=Polyplax serrata TaxID=468196 RepID=A0AAN8NRI0_POLSC